MRKIRLGIIGTGMAFERLHYPALQELSDKFEIVALADHNRTEAEKFAQRLNIDKSCVYDNYMDMLRRDDIEAVDILVPIEFNYEVSENVAKSGKHFICEKPLAPDMQQAEKYLELSSKYNVKILIAENYRYDEENSKIKHIIDSGKIGEVIYFIRNNINNFPADMKKDTFAAKEWRQHPDYPGGAILDGAVHDIATLRHIFGEVECLQSFGKPQKADFSPYVSINTNFLFKNGIIGHFSYFPSGIESLRPLVGFRIFGSLGEIYLEERTCGIINIFYNDGSSEQIGYTPNRGYCNELLNFYHSLNETEQIYVTPELEFKDVKTIFAIMESISKRQVIPVDSDIKTEYPGYMPREFEERRPYVQ